MQHQQMDVEHLLMALLDQERGLATSILNKADIPVDALKVRLHRELEKVPRVTGGGDVTITSRLNRILGQAEDEAKRLKDDYVSVEHFLLALLDDSGTGSLLRVNADGSATQIVGGLDHPGGLAVRGGFAYVSNRGTSAGTGEVLRIAL